MIERVNSELVNSANVTLEAAHCRFFDLRRFYFNEDSGSPVDRFYNVVERGDCDAAIEPDFRNVVGEHAREAGRSVAFRLDWCGTRIMVYKENTVGAAVNIELNRLSAGVYRSEKSGNRVFRGGVAQSAMRDRQWRRTVRIHSGRLVSLIISLNDQARRTSNITN